jgi:hypothetical protein
MSPGPAGHNGALHHFRFTSSSIEPDFFSGLLSKPVTIFLFGFSAARIARSQLPRPATRAVTSLRGEVPSHCRVESCSLLRMWILATAVLTTHWCCRIAGGAPTRVSKTLRPNLSDSRQQVRSALAMLMSSHFGGLLSADPVFGERSLDRRPACCGAGLPDLRIPQCIGCAGVHSKLVQLPAAALPAGASSAT